MKGLIELGKCKILIRCKVRNLHKLSRGFYLKNVEFTLKIKVRFYCVRNILDNLISI